MGRKNLDCQKSPNKKGENEGGRGRKTKKKNQFRRFTESNCRESPNKKGECQKSPKIWGENEFLRSLGELFYIVFLHK